MATTTPNYGWDVPTSSDYVKQGAVAIETLGDDIDASLFSITSGKNVGLVHLNSTLLTSNSSVTVSNVFTNAFDFYRVEIGLKGSAANDLFCRLATGGSPAGTLAYYAQNLTVSGTSVTASSGGNNQLKVGRYSGSDNWLFTVELCFPASVQAKGMNAIGGNNDNLQIHNGVMNVAAVYDGFNIFCTSGTFTGIMSIYGYRK